MKADKAPRVVDCHKPLLWNEYDRQDNETEREIELGEDRRCLVGLSVF